VREVSDTEEKKDTARTSRWSDEPGKEQEMMTAEELTQRDQAEEELIAWLEAKSTLELSQFLASPWVASLLSDEAIEVLSQQLEQREASPLEVGRD
jgi:hypothetical protein